MSPYKKGPFSKRKGSFFQPRKNSLKTKSQTPPESFIPSQKGNESYPKNIRFRVRKCCSFQERFDLSRLHVLFVFGGFFPPPNWTNPIYRPFEAQKCSGLVCEYCPAFVETLWNWRSHEKPGEGKVPNRLQTRAKTRTCPLRKGHTKRFDGKNSCKAVDIIKSTSHRPDFVQCIIVSSRINTSIYITCNHDNPKGQESKGGQPAHCFLWGASIRRSKRSHKKHPRPLWIISIHALFFSRNHSKLPYMYASNLIPPKWVI